MNFKKFSLVVENNHRIKIQGEHARNRRIFFVRQIRRCINFFSLLLSLSSSLNSTNIKQEANKRKKERKRGEQKLHPNRSFQLEIPLIILPPFYHTTLSSPSTSRESEKTPLSLSLSLLGHARFRGREESRATRVAGKEY